RKGQGLDERPAVGPARPEAVGDGDLVPRGPRLVDEGAAQRSPGRRERGERGVGRSVGLLGGPRDGLQAHDDSLAFGLAPFRDAWAALRRTLGRDRGGMALPAGGLEPWERSDLVATLS